MKSTELLQELFTRETPFQHVHSDLTVMIKILDGRLDRPSAENTCFRLTDEWWSMCCECRNTEPSLRPSMVEVTKKIEMIVCSSLVIWLPVTDPRRWHCPVRSIPNSVIQRTFSNGLDGCVYKELFVT